MATTRNPASDWVKQAHKSRAKFDTDKLHIATLVASVRPGVPAPALLAHLHDVVTKSSRLLDASQALDAMASDARFPGWARLYVALTGNRPLLIGELEKYTVPLLNTLGDHHFASAGVQHLPALRKLQMATRGHGPVKVIHPTEVTALLPKVSTPAWTGQPAAAENLARRINFRDASVRDGLTAIRSWRFGPQTSALRLTAFAELAAQHQLFADFRSLNDQGAAEVLALVEEVFHHPVRMRLDYNDEFVTELLLSAKASYQRLGASLVGRNAYQAAPELLQLLATLPKPGEALTRTPWTAEQRVQLLCHRLRRRGLDKTGVKLLRPAMGECDSWQDQMPRLLELLGTDAWVLGYLTVPSLVARHGYSVGAPLPPHAVRAAVAAAKWLEPDKRMQKVLTWLPTLDMGDVDKARAVLAGEYGNAESRFQPTGLLRGWNEYVTAEVAQFCAYDSGTRHAFPTVEDRAAHWAAWARALPASQVPTLMEDVAELKRRAGTGGTPATIATLLDDAFTACGTPDAKAALAASLVGRSDYYSTLPSHMTLIEFANELSKIAHRLAENS